jgi:cytochrome b561
MSTQLAIRPATYGPTLIGLHWLMALLIAAVFATTELRGYYPRGSETRDLLKSLHYMLGLSVLVLVAIRIAVRMKSVTPSIMPPLAWWQTAAAHFVHAALYAAMIGMPLLGWLILSADGKAIPFFGLSLPPLIGVEKNLAHALEDVHEFIGNALYFVIGLHAIAALAHHYLFGDNTLTRMLPMHKRLAG